MLRGRVLLIPAPFLRILPKRTGGDPGALLTRALRRCWMQGESGVSASLENAGCWQTPF